MFTVNGSSLSKLTSDEWAVLSALRGPDNYTTRFFFPNYIKDVTTGVIRYFAGIPVENCNCVVTTPTEALALCFVHPELSNEWLATGPHFRGHVTSAFKALSGEALDYWNKVSPILYNNHRTV